MNFIQVSSIAIAVFTMLLTIIFFTWRAFKDKVVFGAEKFDPSKWMQHAATIGKECKRSDMAFDLQQNILIKRAPKEARIALLGRPSIEQSFTANNSANEYDLGKCRHIYHGLLMFFNANNQLTQSGISSH